MTQPTPPTREKFDNSFKFLSEAANKLSETRSILRKLERQLNILREMYPEAVVYERGLLDLNRLLADMKDSTMPKLAESSQELLSLFPEGSEVISDLQSILPEIPEEVEFEPPAE